MNPALEYGWEFNELSKDHSAYDGVEPVINIGPNELYPDFSESSGQRNPGGEYPGVLPAT